MNVRYVDAVNCISLEMVASPLSTGTAAIGKFDSYRNCVLFHFSNCWKLDQNARNIILADVESRLLHWEAAYLETLLSLDPIAAGIIFWGGDVPDWFNYKSRGSSLTAKLPPHWCNDELFRLVFCVVIEFKQFPRHSKFEAFFYDCHIRDNGGDSFSTNNGLRFSWGLENATQSNNVNLVYDKSLVNNWRIPGKAYDADEISIEFWVGEDFRNCCTVKKCGVHLLYTHEIEDRYRRSVVQPKSPFGDLTQFPLKQDYVDDDIEEAAIEDVKDNEGCNLGNPVEDLAPVRRRKIKRKLKRKTLRNFIKFRWFRGEINSKRVRRA
ncbi:disease resistance protein RPP2B-like [Tripterygium wilfordii]|uniref:disease resistance protein RPP2B-like n=1 Tax=Tripterygium wilfordii TaxID=458696 RepID=UPI0018F8145F|nr:disease resistance protein RPP2B-like [Tripterygium wilfordii]